MTQHAELIARLEAAGSRELDAEVAVAFGYERDGDELWLGGDYYTIYEPDFYDLVGMDHQLPAFTTSLDAALALAERVGLKPAAVLMTVMASACCRAGASVSDLARYACIAILRALEAKA